MRIRGELSRFITPIVLLLIISLLLLPGGKEGLEKVRQLKEGKKPQAEVAEDTAEQPTAQDLSPNFIGLTEADKRRLNFGAQPERRILQELAKQTSLLSELGLSDQARWLIEEALVLNNQWLLATYIDGQFAGQVLLGYRIQGTGSDAEFSWQLLTSTSN